MKTLKMYRFLKLGLVAAMAILAIGAAPQDADPANVSEPTAAQRLHYKIYRKGKTIGDHHVSFVQAEDGAQIEIAFEIRVKFLGITAFKMDHEASEAWSYGPLKLESMAAVTERSSGTFKVSVDEADDGYTIDVNGEATSAPEAFVPTSFVLASHLFTDESRDVVLLDTLSGMLRPSRIDFKDIKKSESFPNAIGTVRYYEITRLDTGAVSHRIWYDETDSFLQVGLKTKDGHYVEYRRQA